jgi:phosphoenolpyruvate synthase/pyruvate phosphate dikinase
MHAQHSGGHTRRDPLVVGLAEARALDVAEIGAKAANLARLAAVGFPVPAGLVVTPAAEERWEEALPHLLEAAGALGVGRFAVRSSGTSEDLEDASFAGQYETILGVPFDGLPEAVRSVFVSADASRVSAYQEAQGEASAGDRRPRMAVLVQAMVGADAAGVAFTANPLTGERGEVVITAVRELGERLVSGAAVGDEWVVRDGEAVCKRADEGAISAGQAANIAALARRVEEHFESPQDIEWAISASRLYLLQARPMTALPEPVDWTPPHPGLLDAQLPARGVAARGDDTPVRRLAARTDRGRAPTRDALHGGHCHTVPVRRDQRLVLHHQP